MLTRQDLIDLIVGHIDAAPRAASGKAIRNSSSSLPEVKGRRFLSEYEIKRLLTGQSEQLTIPKDAILSPLALDWLALRRIRIVRQ